VALTEELGECPTQQIYFVLTVELGMMTAELCGAQGRVGLRSVQGWLGLTTELAGITTELGRNHYRVG
jgi:hypothetical protein